MSHSDKAQIAPLEGYLSPDRIEMLVVHCSDTPDDQPIGAKEIQEMHLGFGWDGIGYHQVICRDGTREAGRPEYWQGALRIPASVMCNIPTRGTLSPSSLASSPPTSPSPPPPGLSSRIGNPLLSACAHAAPRLKGCNDADVGGGGGEEGRRCRRQARAIEMEAQRAMPPSRTPRASAHKRLG